MSKTLRFAVILQQSSKSLLAQMGRWSDTLLGLEWKGIDLLVVPASFGMLKSLIHKSIWQLWVKRDSSDKMFSATNLQGLDLSDLMSRAPPTECL